MPASAVDGVVPAVDPTTFAYPTAVLIGDMVAGHRATLPGCRIGPGALIGIGVTAGERANGHAVHQELAAQSLATLPGVDPLPASPTGPGTLGISPERAAPLRDSRRAARA
jgi:hypothetical protein